MSDDSSQAVTITLEEKISFDNIESLYNQLEQIDSSTVNKVTIDADDVEDIDFVGLQLLLSFLKQMNSENVAVEWDNLSIAMYQAATDIDFCGELAL